MHMRASPVPVPVSAVSDSNSAGPILLHHQLLYVQHIGCRDTHGVRVQSGAMFRPAFGVVERMLLRRFCSQTAAAGSQYKQAGARLLHQHVRPSKPTHFLFVSLCV